MNSPMGFGSGGFGAGSIGEGGFGGGFGGGGFSGFPTGMGAMNRLDPSMLGGEMSALEGLSGSNPMDPMAQLAQTQQSQSQMMQMMQMMMTMMMQLMQNQGAGAGSSGSSPLSSIGSPSSVGSSSPSGSGGSVGSSDGSSPSDGSSDPTSASGSSSPFSGTGTTYDGATAGTSADAKTNAQIVAQVAKEKGVDPVTAVATMLVESGGSNTATGDNGTSFGLFQLHQGGELGSMSQADAQDPRKNAEVALSVFAQNTGKYSDPGQLAAASQRPGDPTAYAQKVDAMIPKAKQLLGMS